MLCVGTTGTGKSTLATLLLTSAPGPKVIVDPMGSSLTASLPGVHTTHDPSGETWPEGVELIRFVPVDPWDLAAYDTVYATIRRLIRTGRWSSCAIECDEAEIVLPASDGMTARNRRNVDPDQGSARGVVYFGRKLSTLHIACATRPKGIAVTLRANMTHAAIFLLPEAKDREAMATAIGMPLAQLEAAMGDVTRRVPGQPSKGFLWWDQSRRTIYPLALEL